ncbi:MAG: hypothetical protein HY658_01675 [Actinobacteria bacterium]|nr:hypothetical protein [Actinomycetota bacterium]
MSQVNLLPRELRERQRIRRQTFLAGAGGAALVLLVLAFYFLQVVRLGEVEDQLADQRAENAQLEQEIASLRQFEELRQRLDVQRALVGRILQNEVSWSGVLRDISLVIPRDMWLTDMTGAVTAPTVGGETAAETTGLIGSIQFNGVSFDTPTLALWLTVLEEPRGWVNAWLSTASKGKIGTAEVVTFSSSVDLTPDAAVRIAGGQS